MEITEDKINIGNSVQSIMTISTDFNNPVLLILHGGPGSPDRPLVLKYNNSLAEKYTIVCWDQRCSGLSYTKENKNTKLTIDLILSDVKELVEYLTIKYKQKKIYIAGHSWGAYIGLRFVSEYPQYVKYYIGTGQGISSIVDENDKYNFVLNEAKARNEHTVIKKIKSFGVPINGNYPHNNDKAKKYIGKFIHKYGGYIHPNNNFSMHKYISIYVNHYKFNTYKVIGGINYSTTQLIPQMDSCDAITGITKLDIPVLFIFGEKDYICPVDAAKRWYESLTVPQKNFVVIKNAAHMVNFEQPEKWNNLLFDILI